MQCSVRKLSSLLQLVRGYHLNVVSVYGVECSDNVNKLNLSFSHSNKFSGCSHGHVMTRHFATKPEHTDDDDDKTDMDRLHDKMIRNGIDRAYRTVTEGIENVVRKVHSGVQDAINMAETEPQTFAHKADEAKERVERKLKEETQKLTNKSHEIKEEIADKVVQDRVKTTEEKKQVNEKLSHANARVEQVTDTARMTNEQKEELKEIAEMTEDEKREALKQQTDQQTASDYKQDRPK